MPAATATPPAAPAAPSAPAAPVAPPSQNDAISFDADIDADLASLDDSKPAPPSPPPKDKTQDKEPPPAEGAKPPAKPQDKPGAKPADKPSGDKPPEGEPVKPVKAADIRGAYEGLKKKIREEYEPEIQSLRSKVKEYETANPEQAEVLTKELESIKKRRDELESEIRFIRYEKSSEFQEKFAKPYEDAWAKAVAELSELTVTDEEGNSRTATANDLMQLANMPLGEARRVAKEMFGDAADDVMAHRRSIRELSAAQNKALEDAKKLSGEREKELATKRQIEHQQTIKLWQTANEELAKKYPKWFSHVEDDPEGNSLLDKGLALADLHFIGAKDLTPEQVELLPGGFKDAIKLRGGLSPKERVYLDALLRNKIASHGRIAAKLKSANARVKELETALAEFENSTPPSGKAGEGSGKGAVVNEFDEAQAELDAIDKKNL